MHGTVRLPYFRAELEESRIATLTSLALLAVGVALRLRAYLDQRSFWLDEIWVVLNVQGRSFAGLARPLDYEQTAPVAFLWTERLALVLGGVNELALRVFPLIAGCLFLVVLWMLARRLLDVRGGALCLAFAALSPALIYFSNEVKPYGPDSLAAAALIWLTLDVLDTPDSRRAWQRLAAGGVIAMLFSTPSIFILAGVGTALVAHPAIVRTRAGWVRLVACGTLWLAVFAIGYVALYRDAATSTFMQTFWRKVFLSLPPSTLAHGAIDAARRLWIAAFLGDNDALIPPRALPLATLVTAAGAVALLRRRGAPVALLLVVPFVATGAASLAHRWPLGARLLVFLIPALVLLLGAGVWTIAGALPSRVRGATLALLGGLVVLPACVYDARGVRLPKRRDDVAPLVRDVMASHATPALVYVVAHGIPAWIYYSDLWRARDGEAFRVAEKRGSPSARYQHRACITQRPDLRVVLGASHELVFTDSALAAEAAWMAAQPERELWLLTLKYEKESGLALTSDLLAQGATKVEERARGDGVLRRFHLPERMGARPTMGCEVQLVATPAARQLTAPASAESAAATASQ
jgi:hypothetical protein